MFGIKTKIINRLKQRFEVGEINDKPISIIENQILLWFAKKELQKESKFINLQSPIAPKTNRFAAQTIKDTADHMPNNLGNWSIKKPWTFTSRTELNLIKLMRKHYACPKDIIGHFGSGTTEGNIYATWMGRNYLTKKLNFPNTEKIILIKSCLAHYSINKAADLTGIKLVESSINEEKFNLDKKKLDQQLGELYNQGFRGFLIPLTLGYTVTGTDDDYVDIYNLVERFEQKHTDCKFFIWLDASFSGISKIFTEKNFQPFAYKKIQLISTDFHKFLAVPYPASVMLYRKNLLNYIKKDIPYINQLDTTLLGSRPGISVLATWMSLINLNKMKIKKLINESINKKEIFLKKIFDENLNIMIINNKNSMQACLISKDKMSTKKLKNKYQLESIDYKLTVNKKNKTIKMYKLYFLPKF